MIWSSRPCRNCTPNCTKLRLLISPPPSSGGGFIFAAGVLHVMATIPLTRRGAEKLRDELARLKSVERHAVILAISEARAQGDLSENAEYEAAKDKQAFIEGRILHIDGQLAAAQIIDPASVDGGGRIVFGTTVILEEEGTGQEVTYQIVGD